MALRNLQHYWTEEEYLAYEASQEERHEYADGVIYDMAGASEEHLLINQNVSGLIWLSFRKRANCRVYANDKRVLVQSARNEYFYPDVAAVCGKRETRMVNSVEVLLNPTVLVEVLSPSTETLDRGNKSTRYRALASLQEYLLIAQDRVHITHYTRQPSGAWASIEYIHPEATVTLTSIQCSFSVAEVYEKVDFQQQ